MDNLKLISKIALSFQDLNNFDSEMNKILEDIGSAIDVSRIYVFLNEKEDIMNNTFEWCNQGIEPQIMNLQQLKYIEVPSWNEMLKNDGCVCSSDISNLPKDIIDRLEPQQVKAIFAYPLIIENEIRGCIGFDECRDKRIWKEAEIEVLSTISGLIASAYQRKFFQQKLIENFELFSKIFENNPLAMTITSLEESKFIKVNPAFIEKIGYFEAEVLGKTIEEINIFVDYKKVESMKNKRLKKQKVKNEELLIRCKNGKVLHALLSVEEISNQSEQSLLSVIVDITDRVELTKSVEDKFQKLTSIIEGTNLGTWEWNIKTSEVELNTMWATMLGYSLEELQPNITEIWDSLVHPEDLKIIKDSLQMHLNDEAEFCDCEIRMKHKDGRWIWIHDIGKVTQKDDNRNPYKMFGTHSDITSRKEADEKLKESEKRFYLALDETKAGLWDFDLINNTVFLSPMWKAILGYCENEIEDSFEAWKELWHPEDIDKTQKSVDDYLEGKSKKYEIINRLKHKNGTWRWILTRGGILRNGDEKPYRWIGTNIDITSEQEQALELERFFYIYLDLLCISDMQGNFIKTNHAWKTILGYSSDELKERNFLEFIHPDDMQSTLEAISKLDQGEKIFHFINRYISASGEYHYMEWISNAYEGVIYASARDITERMEYERKILEISNKDPLTNVYNRRYVFNRAEEIIEEYKRLGKLFSVCIIDIDHFKVVNDTYGHQIGDKVLKELTRILDENLRPYDILGRYGGEEFIILLNNTEQEESILIIKRILEIVRKETMIFSDVEINITFSAGISHCEEIDKEDILIDDLVKIADLRMYKAKQTGRNKIVFRD